MGGIPSEGMGAHTRLRYVSWRGDTQNVTQHVMQYVMQLEIDAPARAAWMVLGEQFGQIARWTSTLDESWLEGDLGPGALRVCQSSQSFGPFPPSKVTERLLDYDPALMELRYEATQGMPAMFREAVNHWRIETVSDTRCRVVSTAQVRLAWWALPLTPLMRIMMKSPMKAFELEVRRAVEHARGVLPRDAHEPV